MKIQATILTIIAAMAFGLTGCNKSSGDASTIAISVDTSKLEATFASADEATKKELEPIISSVKNADYEGAISKLKSFGEKFKLTDEQQAEVNGLMDKAQKAIKAASEKAAGDVSKALDKSSPLSFG